MIDWQAKYAATQHLLSAVNQENRAYRLQIADLTLQLAALCDLLRVLSVTDNGYPIRNEVLLVDDRADPLECITHDA